MSKTADKHILTGVNELLRTWITGLSTNSEKLPLKEILNCIEDNFSPSRPDNLSKANWRFVKQLKMSGHNLSSEKVLEKRISSLADGRWVNQVPTASGFFGSRGRKRSIDLVLQKAETVFVFYELKTTPKSGNAVEAAIEILGYGSLYVYSRTRLSEYNECRLMKASEVHLRVLGTSGYYLQQSGGHGNLRKLQDVISGGLKEFASMHLLGCKLDFGFDTFPKKFAWSVEDQENKSTILNALDGICPLFG